VTFRAALTLWACAAAIGCSAPPWQIGRPLDGRASIPPTEARPTPAEARQAAARARAAGQPVLELRALAALERSWRLDAVLRAEPTAAESARLAELLFRRAAMFHVLGRPIPESRDLEAAARLDPARGKALGRERATAAAAAGDRWKAIDAPAEARAAFILAARLGGVPPDAPPLTPAPLIAATVPLDVERWVLGGPTLSGRLLPLAAARPSVLDDLPRALRWAEILLEEDPTSPEVLELVALIFGRAGRFGGTDRMLTELTFYTPDRAAGLARGAAVWDQLGRPREACAQWIRAARWRDQPTDPLWLKAISCARKDPGAGSWQEIRAYVLGRARPEQRESLAAALDGRPPPVAGEAAAADAARPAADAAPGASSVSSDAGADRGP
jgi:tetratricopeptide (TPR) repeat protein